jgi:3-deoxy-D-manno-octulosonic-acid transferase
LNRFDLLYLPLAAVTAPWWGRKSRSDWSGRFGRIPPVPARAHTPRRLLLHAVSVGEVNALRTLVPLLQADVSTQVIVSAGTDTGLARARELFAASCDVVRYPLDFSWSVRRFLDAARPDAVALVELELWPNFIHACRRRGIPVCVINGRLSERSFRGYLRLRRFLAPTFASLEFAAVQDECYARRFEAMGVPSNDCLITGSMKWDAARIEDEVAGADALASDLGIDRSRPLIVAGSTGPGEEQMLHAACPPGVQLLCAPRKPERFDEAAADLPGCVRRSARRAGSDQVRRSLDRFLLDTIGELRAAYSLADLVVVGRSFGSLHGSDPVEPIALGKPTVIGPAVSDFASIVEAFEHADGIVRADRASLPGMLRELLDDPVRRRDIAARGRACIREHQGASARHAELLLSLLDHVAPAPTAARINRTG